jgi:hypothetical protein
MRLVQNLLSHFYEARTRDFVIHWLSPGQTPDGLKREVLTPDEQYLRIELRSLRVVNVQQGLTRLYGMVNSQISLPHLAQGDAQFQTIVAPPELKDVDAAYLDRFVSFHQPLAGPVPFRGGNVRIQVGLFSVASTNLLSSYVGLLEEISKNCSVEFINAALPYAGLLSKGVALLTGTANPQMLEIGVSAGLDPVTSGWLLVMRADAADFPMARLEQLTVNPADSKLLEGTKPVNDYPYMLFRFSGSRNRDDWFKIPELQAQHALFTKALRKGDANDIQPALASFERFLYTCPDLLTSDADKVAKKAKEDVGRLYPTTGTAAGAKEIGEPRRLCDYDIYAE